MIQNGIFIQSNVSHSNKNYCRCHFLLLTEKNKAHVSCLYLKWSNLSWSETVDDEYHWNEISWFKHQRRFKNERIMFGKILHQKLVHHLYNPQNQAQFKSILWKNLQHLCYQLRISFFCYWIIHNNPLSCDLIAFYGGKKNCLKFNNYTFSIVHLNNAQLSSVDHTLQLFDDSKAKKKDFNHRVQLKPSKIMI